MMRIPPAFGHCSLRLLSVLLFALCAVPAHAGLKVYYLRHAESGANAAYNPRWKQVPRDQWPSYLGNPDTFSPKGEEQAQEVAGKLKDHAFDFIVVSPLWRTRNTILPYLRATGQKGEIWPELAEFDVSIEDILEGNENVAGDHPHSPDLFTGGAEIVLPDNEKEFFTLRPGAATLVKIGADSEQEVADRRAIVARAAELLREKFAGTDKTILVVGHGNAGRLLARELTGDARVLEDGNHIHNIHLWMAEEQPDGTFRLELFNDQAWGRVER
ncbi:MAG: histidine phosphatase family protein [Chthoniobacterales bacterium]|nr:histidine phosphatase family protein [Chthoniobacterales bacterium]